MSLHRSRDTALLMTFRFCHKRQSTTAVTAIVTCCKDFPDVFFTNICEKKYRCKEKKRVKLFAIDNVISGIQKKEVGREATLPFKVKSLLILAYTFSRGLCKFKSVEIFNKSGLFCIQDFS